MLGRWTGAVVGRWLDGSAHLMVVNDVRLRDFTAGAGHLVRVGIADGYAQSVGRPGGENGIAVADGDSAVRPERRSRPQRCNARAVPEISSSQSHCCCEPLTDNTCKTYLDHYSSTCHTYEKCVTHPARRARFHLGAECDEKPGFECRLGGHPDRLRGVAGTRAPE